jgi:hypothetical protein
MTKKKPVWRSHDDGSHYLIPDKSALPKGSMKVIEPVDEAIDSEHEITGEDERLQDNGEANRYAQEMYPEEYDETLEEREGREIIEEIQEEKAEGDHSAFGKKAEGRLKDIEEKITVSAIKGGEKTDQLGVKLRREIRKMILKRQLKEQEEK